jgi:hypothetical protein
LFIEATPHALPGSSIRRPIRAVGGDRARTAKANGSFGRLLSDAMKQAAYQAAREHWGARDVEASSQRDHTPLSPVRLVEH